MDNKQALPRLKIGVIGYGAMGRNHTRLCEEIKGLELSCVIDPIEKHQSMARNKFGCKVYKSIFDVDLNGIDAFCVVAPTAKHFEIASYLIKNRKPCLIEKPLVSDITECQKLIDLQKEFKVPVLVGHIERFNPAFIQLERILQSENIIGIDVQRLSYSSSRIVDTDVILDLMIHDIDIIMALLGKDKIIATSARSYSKNKNGSDYVCAILQSQSGRIINLTASRLTHNKLRILQVTTHSSHIKVDYTDQKIDIHRQGRIYIADKEDNPHYIIETLVEKVIVRHDEPLAKELKHFASCVRGTSKPIISMQQATDSLSLAYKIQECVK